MLLSILYSSDQLSPFLPPVYTILLSIFCSAGFVIINCFHQRQEKDVVSLAEDPLSFHELGLGKIIHQNNIFSNVIP